jgi:hypothetical protein
MRIKNFLVGVVLLVMLIGCNLNKPEQQTEEPVTTKDIKPIVNTPTTSSKECGDGVCSRKEVYEICQQDCIETCGDDVVQDNENWKNCRFDLLKDCGNGVCEEWEHYQYCKSDCESCIIDPANKYEGPDKCPPNPRWVD